jgi:hypothetical protein
MLTRILITSSLLLIPAAAAEKFQPLFNGRNLDGWEVKNGQAKYEVVNGTIVGTTAEGSPNSFLCTTRNYSDFILEFDVNTDVGLNSGVQIRSHVYDQDRTVETNNGKQMVKRQQRKGRVHGYQVEVSTEKAANSGGIYDEARRGWLANPAESLNANAACSKAFKDGQWNHYRIEARGDSLKTWLNGVACSDLKDSMDTEGFIGLQVHQYKGEKPASVRWRNVRIADLAKK